MSATSISSGLFQARVLSMARLVLHRAVWSPPSRAVLVLCDMLSLPVHTKEVDVLGNQQKSPAFKKLNPMGMVPVLEDGNFVVSESHAIMKYVLGRYGGDKHETLYPSDVRTRALVDQAMFFDAGVFFRALRTIARVALHQRLPGLTPRAVQSIEEAFGMADSYLQGRGFMAGQHLTLADISAGCTGSALNSLYKVDSDKYPHCADWLARLEQEPAFQSVDQMRVSFAQLIQDAWDSNKNKNENKK